MEFLVSVLNNVTFVVNKGIQDNMNGSEDIRPLDAGEIIVKTKKQVLMYIFSQKKNGGTV